MKRVLIVLTLALLVAAPAAGAATPKEQLKAQKARVAALQKQLAKVKKTQAAKVESLNAKITTMTTTASGLNGQIATLNTQVATISGQLAAANTTSAATIASLNGQLATQTAKVAAQAQGGLQAVLAGNPTDLWNAVIAIWQVFPMFGPSDYCGFDKTSSSYGGTGLNNLTYSFRYNTNC